MFYAGSLPALHVKIASVQSIVSLFTRNVLVLSFRLICPCPAVYCSFASVYHFLRQSSVSFYVSYVLMFILSCCFFQILHLEQPDSLNILLNTVMSFEVVARFCRGADTKINLRVVCPAIRYPH